MTMSAPRDARGRFVRRPGQPGRGGYTEADVDRAVWAAVQREREVASSRRWAMAAWVGAVAAPAALLAWMVG